MNQQVKPILKWVGGKTQLLSELYSLLPNEKITTYCEPFLGGGAMLFNIQPNIAYVNDSNTELINVYNTIKLYPEELILELNKYDNTSDFYYKIRSLDREPDKFMNLSSIQRAARFIYLNKTCFNGLYRENSKGQFNVPYGNYKNPNFINMIGIHNMSQYFNTANIHFTSCDFSQILNIIPSESFVYIDPPYDPISETSNFTNYTSKSFTKIDQVRLRDCCDNLTKRGIKFMLSNSDTNFIRYLYINYNITEVLARRNINCNGNKRNSIKELVIRNYDYKQCRYII